MECSGSLDLALAQPVLCWRGFKRKYSDDSPVALISTYHIKHLHSDYFICDSQSGLRGKKRDRETYGQEDRDRQTRRWRNIAINPKKNKKKKQTKKKQGVIKRDGRRGKEKQTRFHVPPSEKKNICFWEPLVFPLEPFAPPPPPPHLRNRLSNEAV